MRHLRVSMFGLLMLLLASTGCNQPEEIQQLTETHQNRQLLHLRVAILPRGDDVFFFRISGPEKLVKNNLPDFESLVRSVRFDDNNDPPISWAEPKDWIKDPAEPEAERIAHYRVATEPPLTVKITVFPAQRYELVGNLNRWQKEMHLPFSNREDAKKFTRSEKIAGLDATWVDLTSYGVYTPSKPIKVARNVRRNPPQAPANAKGATPFKFVAPKEWVSKPANDGITAVRFDVKEGGESATVTLTAAGGPVAGNIVRWAKQIDLPNLSERDALQSAKTVKVAGLEAHYVDLKNPQGPQGKNHILGVVVPLGDRSWFIKMTGPLELVSRNQNAFENFFHSFELDIPRE